PSVRNFSITRLSSSSVPPTVTTLQALRAHGRTCGPTAAIAQNRVAHDQSNEIPPAARSSLATTLGRGDGGSHGAGPAARVPYVIRVVDAARDPAPRPRGARQSRGAPRPSRRGTRAGRRAAGPRDRSPTAERSRASRPGPRSW